MPDLVTIFFVVCGWIWLLLLLAQYNLPSRFQPSKFALDIVLLMLFLSVPMYYHVNYSSVLQQMVRIRLVNLDPTSQYYAVWATNNTEPVHLKMTFFDVMNADKLVPQLNSSVDRKMAIRETSPFRFHQYSSKFSLNYSADQRTLFYYESNTYILDPATDLAVLDTAITVPNFPLIALLAQVERFNGVNNYMPIMPLIGGTILDSYSVDAINRLLANSNESLFIRITPRELIFGYQMKLGAFINEFIDTMTGNKSTEVGNSTSKFTKWFRPKPEKSATRKIGNFSLFNLLNNTLNGPFEIYTGLNGTASVFSQIRSYQGLDRFSLWKSESCNVVDGTDILGWNQKDKAPIRAFIPGACRSVDLQYEQTVRYKNIALHKYIISPTSLMSPAAHPANTCYCTHSASNCVASGTIDLSSCYDGIPLLFTKPYFADIYPQMASFHRIEFTSSPTETTETQLYLHPMFGITLYGYINSQLSLRLSNDSQFELMRTSISGEYTVPFVHFWKELSMDDDTAYTFWIIQWTQRFHFFFIFALYFGTIFFWAKATR